MKIRQSLFAALLVLASCSESAEESQIPVAPQRPLVPISVKAQYAADMTADGTRAIIENKDSKWEQGDAVSFYALSYGTDQTPAAQVTAEVYAEGKRAMLLGNVPAPTEPDTYFTAFPVCDLNSTRAQFTIPAAQTATATPQLMMAAKQEAADLDALSMEFKAATAFLCVKIAPSLSITSVRFEGCNSEAVAGTYEYRFNDETTVLTGTDKSITITNPTAEVYFILPAMTLSKGYKLTFFKGSEQMIKTYGYGVSKEILAGNIYNVPEVTAFTPIGVTLGTVTTSYSLYTEGKIAEANAFANNQITVGECSFAGIPNALIAEAGITFDGSNTTTVVSTTAKTFTGTTFTTSTRATHSIKAYIKDIDGNVYETAVTDAIITGLPYTANPPRNSGDYAWSGSGGITWNSGNVQLAGGFSSPSITSAAFYIPADINTTVNVSGDKSGTISTTLTVQVGGTNIISNAPGGNYSLSGNGTFTPANTTIYCRSSYGAVGPSLRIANLTANYR